jgi:predicted phosphodiesterase
MSRTPFEINRFLSIGMFVLYTSHTMNLYMRLYIRNIQKYLCREKKESGFLGHMHTPMNEENFTVIGTFHNGYIYEDATTIVIADVHIGLYTYSATELAALHTLLSRKDKQIILLGDFFDLFYAKPADLLRDHRTLITCIKEQQRVPNLIYIRGNHDWNVTPLLGIESVAQYSKGNMLFFHGHVCDPYHSIFPFNILQKIRFLLGYRLHWLRYFYLKINP